MRRPQSVPHGAEDEWICIIGGSRSHLPYIEAAHRLGLKTLVLDRDASSPGARSASRFIAISTHDVQNIVTETRNAGRIGNLRGCFTASSHPRPMEAAARVSRLLRLPGGAPSAVANTHNKMRMKECLSAGRVPTPLGRLVASERELGDFLEGHGPAIIKPVVGGTGSAGVTLASSRNSHLGSLVEYAQRASGDGRALMEALQRGPEYSVDGFVQSGKAHVLSVGRKYSLGAAMHFVIHGFAIGLDTPEFGHIEVSRTAHLAHLGQRAVDALGIDNCYFSLDVIATSQGPMVVDAGLLLDAKIDRLLQFTGLDVYTLRCLLAIGEVVRLDAVQPGFDRGYALRFLYASEKGQLRRSRRRARYRAGSAASRWTIEWERQPGDVVRPPTSVSDVVGWLLIEADDRDAAWRLGNRMEAGRFFDVQRSGEALARTRAKPVVQEGSEEAG